MAKFTLNDLNRKLLLDYAGSRSFERGEHYFKTGCVFDLTEYQGKIVAKVSGTRDYRVKLWAGGEDELGYDCSCPFAEDGNFCKHCVAAGLAWIGGDKSRGGKKSGGAERSTALDGVKTYLQTREKSELIEMLMQQALENETFRGSLLLDAARSNPRGVDVETYRNELKRVFDARDYDDYDDYGYHGGGYGNSEDIEKTVESIEELLEEGHAETVIDLCEYALRLAAQTIDRIPDEEGEIYQAMEQLQDLHLRACERAKPEAEKLARRLFEWELRGNWDVFHDATRKYADTLGKKGLRLYRRLVEEEWEKLPALKPGDKKSYEGKRWQITSMMESLAYAEGDIEKLVEIKSRDLSSQFQYYEIAEIYRKKRKYDKALEWAERGVGDFPKTEKLDWRLGELLAGEYHRRGRHDEAMRIIWQNFEENPDLGRYGSLKEHADRVKPESAWPEWREKALALIRRKIAESKKRKADIWFHRPLNNSPLVEIFLSENLTEEAWREAGEGGCSEYLWLKLAGIREKEHPADALEIYRVRVERKIEETNNQAYRQAAEWVQKIRDLMTRLGSESEFEDYLVALRVNYKIKRNFIKLLDSIKW